MKIEIRKNGKITEILIDGQCVSCGCTGWEVTSKGGGFAELAIRFIAKETDIEFEVDNPISQTQESQEQKKTRQLFHSSLPKR